MVLGKFPAGSERRKKAERPKRYNDDYASDASALPLCGRCVSWDLRRQNPR